MLKSPTFRWVFLLSALAATIAAILMPEEESVATSARPKRTAPPRAVPPAALASAKTELQREWLASEENPFAPRGWIAPPPAPAPAEARTVAPVVLSEALPPPPPAPLPFRFLGQIADGDDRVIYLGLGEQLLTARQGDVLDGHFKVVSIGGAQMEFEHTTSGLRQTLPLPAQDK